MAILAIDPGPAASGWVVFGHGRVLYCGTAPNGQLLSALPGIAADRMAIEMVAHYGMPVGREVFETVWWIGRFTQAWHSPEAVLRVYRQEVKLQLCHSTRAKDANVRQALIDRFGGKEKAIGRKKTPGPLYGVSGHIWSALAVAIVAGGEQEMHSASDEQALEAQHLQEALL